MFKRPPCLHILLPSCANYEELSVWNTVYLVSEESVISVILVIFIDARLSLTAHVMLFVQSCVVLYLHPSSEARP